MSIIFTPKGLSVSSRQRRISPLTHSASQPPAEMSPKPPAFATAAARRASAILAIPPWISGYFIPKSSQMFFINLPLSNFNNLFFFFLVKVSFNNLVQISQYLVQNNRFVLIDRRDQTPD